MRGSTRAARILPGARAEAVAVREADGLSGVLSSAELAPFCGYDAPRMVREASAQPGGDAFLTAQVFLRRLRAARRPGLDTPAALCEPYPAH